MPSQVDKQVLTLPSEVVCVFQRCCRVAGEMAWGQSSADDDPEVDGVYDAVKQKDQDCLIKYNFLPEMYWIFSPYKFLNCLQQ